MDSALMTSEVLCIAAQCSAMHCGVLSIGLSPVCIGSNDTGCSLHLVVVIIGILQLLGVHCSSVLSRSEGC